uniref:Uncharacterized protein n=1 Tax=Thermogemmatispora argillosa TaxID=2045280 RepID=A0A455SZ43_9CHLR|nr:hypothetical protein KTA_10170 [Thermogemmatispora argillosa]
MVYKEVEQVAGAIREEDAVTGLGVISIYQQSMVMAPPNSSRPLAYWPLTIQPIVLLAASR